jgi:large repetitive protein
MHPRVLKKYFVVFMLIFSANLFSQSYTVVIEKIDEECNKGAAGANVQGATVSDTINYEWSNGKEGVASINELAAGNYNLHLTINSNKLDTVIYFKIEKIECQVKVSNQFTPNGDNYNDTWTISAWEYYPNFELEVYNKWGQRVHRQKQTFAPWDGTWNGINVIDGTYYYVFYYESGKPRHVKGDVTILR